MNNADIRAVAEGMADKIDAELGEGGQLEAGEWRILSRIGARRETALGAEGVDETLEIGGPNVAGEVEAFLLSRAEVHHSGPETYLYAVLRRKGKAGNVAVSPPIRIGGGDETHGRLAATRDDAIAALAGMAPRALELMERITVRSLAFAETARGAETDAKVMMAQLVGRAEAGDENARWEAAAAGAAHLAPVLSEAVAAWRASMRPAGPEPVNDVSDALRAWNAWPPEVREAIAAEILRQAQASGGEA